MATTWLKVTHNETAAGLKELLQPGSADPRNLCHGVAAYFESLAGGSRGATVQVALAEKTGTAATGTWTSASGSGVQTLTVNGVAFSGTWATSDTVAAAAMKALVNASTDPRIAGVVTANNSSGVLTVTAVATDATGNLITLAGTGTGVTVSGATLSGSVAAAASGTITMASSSGTVGAVINGVTVTVTWATSDTASSAALATAINGSANALVAGLVTATSALGVTTITAVQKGKSGNAITLAATGTNVTASGTRLTGGTDLSYTSYARI